ncbi:hypothetical protein FK268_19330 [Tsukamurella sputi]|uniref:Uncharacterized protein n=1 Tax=Tsukamurella sputi TaxID=2591848 RepID=A0A5C5RHQ0_9ACTN|nr:hypothetical protein [Tsukamurella sputi]TWS22609.1 hypothetical protein FK268_19330 [Tsukamurella sputi]
MSSLAPTDRRYAVRVGFARTAAGVIGAALAILLLAIGSLPVDPASEFDTRNGTREYPDVDAILTVCAVSALIIPIAAAIGLGIGRGRCRGFCGIVLAIAAYIYL